VDAVASEPRLGSRTGSGVRRRRPALACRGTDGAVYGSGAAVRSGSPAAGDRADDRARFPARQDSRTRLMRRLAAAACAALLLGSLCAPAAAFVVEVTTSVGVEDAEDTGQIRNAIQAAVENVLHDAIAFHPTLVVLTHAMVMGHRLYVRLLLADAEGE